jgi:hypothetical protein
VRRNGKEFWTRGNGRRNRARWWRLRKFGRKQGFRASEAEVTEEREADKGKGKREVRRARKEARRSERKVRELERSEQMKDLIYLVRELGSNVDRFVDEVRVLNVLRNRVDREYLEERRRWYFTYRMRNAVDLNEDSERYSV